ncbi:hypothetical protein LINPERPRIM_LOCUS19284 [Linum perenne]
MHGATGNINVWQPQVYPNEIVVAQFWVTDNGGPGTAEAIEAGYMVTPSDPEPRIFIYWTADGYKSTGCYNLDCPGFVQTSAKGTVLGAIIHPISKYGDSQQEIISVKFEAASEMGSGHFPSEGFGKAAFFSNLLFLNADRFYVDANGIKVQATKPGCYDIVLNDNTVNWGVNFYYGGPGNSSPTCKY